MRNDLFYRKKKIARGEGGSGLAFDQVIHVDYENQEALAPAPSDQNS